MKWQSGDEISSSSKNFERWVAFIRIAGLLEFQREIFSAFVSWSGKLLSIHNVIILETKSCKSTFPTAAAAAEGARKLLFGE